MLKLNDVLECRRMMEYKGAVIEYTTGLNEVYVNAQDILYVMQNVHSKDFGYLQSMEDFVYLLDKQGCISQALKCYDNYIIADYLYEKPINIDYVIELSSKLKVKEFTTFLRTAKGIIIRYGVYVPHPEFTHYDRRKNDEKNLAITFDSKALSEAAYRLNVYEDNLYFEVANAMTNIVFGRDVESLRYEHSMLYEEYLSDYMTDFEYDKLAYCCKVASYILNYSDVGVYGVEVFTTTALNMALQDVETGRIKYSAPKNTSVISEIFDNATHNDELEYTEERMRPRQEVSQKDVDDYKRYM